MKKNLPHGFDIYLLISKLRGRFFQIFVAFSEYLNFKLLMSRKPETQIGEKNEKSNIVDNSGEEENKSRNFKIVNFRFLHHGRKLLLSQVIHIYSQPIYVLKDRLSILS